MDPAAVVDLRHFVELCKSKPSVLHDPSLGFFREYLHSLGGGTPTAGKAGHVFNESGEKMRSEPNLNDKDGSEDKDLADEIIESDVEFDDDVVDADNEAPQEMGDPTKEVSEDSQDAAQSCKAKAVAALTEDKLEEAIKLLTEAIIFNPKSAILLSYRASVFLKMQKPNAAIRDANAALQINPDSAKGYKTRGLAMAMLGHWEEAANDLHLASKLDHDDEIGSALKKVEPNVKKIEEHRRKYERLRKERDMKKADCERRKAEAQRAELDSKHLAALQEGSVHGILSADELGTKLEAASALSRLVVLYFTAAWCGPCRYVSPVYTELARKYPKAVFLKVDIDELNNVARRWGIESVPTFIFVRNGREIDKVVGADKNGLEKKLEVHANK